MSAAAPGTLRQALPTERLFKRLAGQLHKLGLSVSFWDPAGAALAPPTFQGQYCRRMCSRKSPDVRRDTSGCLGAMGQSAQKACLEDRSVITTSSSGCCMLAVPMHQRRRLPGAVVACFPMPQTPDSEEFARACSQAHLDSGSMAALCRKEAKHTEHQAECLASVVEWMVRDEQAKQVAQEELATLSANLANTYEELSLLYRISGSMKVTQSTTEFFETLCQELLEVMRIEAAAVVLHPREHGDSTDRVVSAGQLSLTAEQLIQISRRYVAPRISPDARSPNSDPRSRGDVSEFGASSSGRPIIDNQFSSRAAHLGPEVRRIDTLIAVPLMSADHYKGALIGTNKLDGEFDSVDLKLISSISSQAAVFLENHHLYEDLQDLLMGMLHALTASIDAKDPYTCGHSHRVALVSKRLARMHGLDEHRVGRVYLAGLLHDIGKIGIPESVLRKTGRLTAAEYDIVQGHPKIGAAILGGIRQMEDIIPVILYHHERLDGRGYPEGLSGPQIPFEALIVGLADSFDAMTSHRTYRATMPLEAVAAELRRCSGTQFDPGLVELMLSLDLQDFLGQIKQEGSDSDEPGEVSRSRIGVKR